MLTVVAVALLVVALLITWQLGMLLGYAKSAETRAAAGYEARGARVARLEGRKLRLKEERVRGGATNDGARGTEGRPLTWRMPTVADAASLEERA